MTRKLQESGLTKAQLRVVYAQILRSRRLDERMLQLQRTGKTSFHTSGQGQEIGQAGMAMAFEPGKDYYLPYYRDMTAFMLFGITAKEILMDSFGRYDGPSGHGLQMPNHYAAKRVKAVSQSSTVASQYPVATGIAYGAKLENSDRVTLVTTGDGSTGEGEFHEALNFAGVAKLPVVFVIENNGYAISTPHNEEYAAKSLALRGQGYGIPGVDVDGLDFTATYLAFKEAVTRARKGDGATLINLHVLRMQDHTSDDNQRIYRSKAELAEVKAADPLKTITQQVLDEGIYTQAELADLEKQLKKDINVATDQAEAAPLPDLSVLSQNVFAPVDKESGIYGNN
ncbi:branched-chain alpha-keto acid dehydrogenase, E1 component, subunit alpha [Agrilactobacillus composti DSM 18527 = JCM 14202]|uniref:2-oxoisovalerate dehydrogenase subunit alpha n=1 Tax=Agrilactobacillus composti DSM 18527 = JCM 14202 TaxID=1423734 RepID=A0A0R1XZ24_9LACO|nr:thiamine pyrophosphate-dependent dehydrogenase E1 component subunit alpha [Agrilactobacillus composti]KRM33113.1 branched-chain alpha-keto acid dehydrogenase, E1 component, subunit alpha [Agrilactobacillus composti DSM 18527 = JCM 14202]